MQLSKEENMKEYSLVSTYKKHGFIISLKMKKIFLVGYLRNIVGSKFAKAPMLEVAEKNIL